VRVPAAVRTGARTTFTDYSPNGTAVGTGGGILVGQGALPMWRLGCTGTFGKIGINMMHHGRFETMRGFKSRKHNASNAGIANDPIEVCRIDVGMY
jgi:hypothetical protein